MEHLFLDAHLQPSKICDIISLLQQEGTYPQVAILRAPNHSNSEETAFHYLVEQFITKLEENKRFMTEAQILYFSKCDASTLLKYGDSKKESFLFMIASYLQHIQEFSTSAFESHTLNETKSDTEGLAKKLVVEESMPEKSKSGHEKQKERKGEINVGLGLEALDRIDESQDVEDEEPNDDDTHEQSKDLKKIAPFASMVTPNERKWFKEFAPFMVGKARSITRVVNVYNLARYVAGQLLQNYTNDDTFKRKLMKVIILAEFWPYRTAFLMQVAVSSF